MAVKLEDVARVAGVSKTTVSRVLNRRGYLSQKTIAKVESAIEKLNYHPNTIARQLYNNKTDLVGILVPTVSNPFFGELTYYLETRLFLDGFKVLIGNAMNDPLKEEQYLKQLLGHQVDGLIVGTHNRGIVEYDNIKLPVVAVERKVSESVPIVESDSYQGGVLATESLLNSGIKNIVHTNGPLELETPDQMRRVAYENVMQQHGLKPVTYTVDFNISVAEKEQVFRRIFKEHPEVEGIFAANDYDAVLIMNMAKKLGYEIPADLKLVGYDGTDMVQKMVPQLATIVQPVEKMADEAVNILEKKMNGEQTKDEYKFDVYLKKGTTV